MEYDRILTIAVPTYNHPDYIEYYIKNIGDLDKYKIKLVFFDSSTNDETREIIEKSPLFKKNIFYQKYENIDVDLKTILLLNNIDTKYVYLCGDGVLLNLDFFDKIYTYLLKDIDILELYDDADDGHIGYYNELKHKYKTEEIEYKSILSHFSENYWHMPYYGGSIVKSNLFSQFNPSNMSDLIGCGFVYPYMIYTSLACKDVDILVIGGKLINLNPLKKSSIWLKKGNGLKIWIDNYNQAINSLPSFYDNEKNDVIKTTGKRTRFFTLKGLLGFRAYNNINLKLLRKYKNELRFLTGFSSITLFVISIFPKFILRIVRNLRRKIKN